MKKTNRPYTDKMQEQNLDATVAGIGTSGEEDIAKNPGPFATPDMGGNADGDNPSMPTSVPFATGHDCRYYENTGGGDPAAGKTGA